MGEPYLWRTANMSPRTCVVVKQMQSNPNLWGGVAQYSVYEVTPDKRKVRDQGRGGRTSHLDILACDHFRPAHFHSWVAGSEVQYISLICTPNHHRGKLGTLYHRVVGTRMTNSTGHRPMHSASLGHGMSSLDFDWASHNKVIYLIRPNTDVASISGVLHLVWPLSQSLSSMVEPTRSQNSSWHSLWGLRGTQAPQLQQSNNTLGGDLDWGPPILWLSHLPKRDCWDLSYL